MLSYEHQLYRALYDRNSNMHSTWQSQHFAEPIGLQSSYPSYSYPAGSYNYFPSSDVAGTSSASYDLALRSQYFGLGSQTLQNCSLSAALDSASAPTTNYAGFAEKPQLFSAGSQALSAWAAPLDIGNQQPTYLRSWTPALTLDWMSHIPFLNVGTPTSERYTFPTVTPLVASCQGQSTCSSDPPTYLDPVPAPPIKDLPRVPPLLLLAPKEPLTANKKPKCVCPNCIVPEGNQVRGPDGKLQHICHIPGCGKTYSRPYLLEQHISAHNGETPVPSHPCKFPKCHKIFMRSDELLRHIRTHTNEKTHYCPQCFKKFMRADHVTKHMKSHEKLDKRLEQLADEATREERTFACDWRSTDGARACDRVFKGKKELQRHVIKVHTKEKSYACPFCDKRSARRDALKVHVTKIHGGDKWKEASLTL